MYLLDLTPKLKMKMFAADGIHLRFRVCHANCYSSVEYPFHLLEQTHKLFLFVTLPLTK